MAPFFPLMAGAMPKVKLRPGLKREIVYAFQKNPADAVPEAIDGGWSPPDALQVNIGPLRTSKIEIMSALPYPLLHGKQSAPPSSLQSDIGLPLLELPSASS